MKVQAALIFVSQGLTLSTASLVEFWTRLTLSLDLLQIQEAVDSSIVKDSYLQRTEIFKFHLILGSF